MKKWFLNSMICIAAIGVLASIISLTLCEWDEVRFWQNTAIPLFNFYFFIIWINYKRHDV